MSNWFENNATKSIITYSLTIIAISCTGTYFILDENKDNKHQSEINSSESRIKSLNEKIQYLQFANENLSTENTKLISMIQSIPGNVLYFNKKIAELEKSNRIDTVQNKETGTKNTYTFQSNPISKGNAFIDKKTGATIGLNIITSNSSANGILNLPNQKEMVINNVIAGKKWSFKYENTSYEITIQEINYITDKYKIIIKEI